MKKFRAQFYDNKCNSKLIDFEAKSAADAKRMAKASINQDDLFRLVSVVEFLGAVGDYANARQIA